MTTMTNKANRATLASRDKPFQRTAWEDLVGYSDERARELVSWTEVHREARHDGEFVFCRRGTGETGWWHDHKDGEDHGGNPMDVKRDGTLECRKCGVIWLDPPNLRKSRSGKS